MQLCDVQLLREGVQGQSYQGRQSGNVYLFICILQVRNSAGRAAFENCLSRHSGYPSIKYQLV